MSYPETTKLLNQVRRIKRLLRKVVAREDERCRYDHNNFCQAHYCHHPCLLERIRKELDKP